MTWVQRGMSDRIQASGWPKRFYSSSRMYSRRQMRDQTTLDREFKGSPDQVSTSFRILGVPCIPSLRASRFTTILHSQTLLLQRCTAVSSLADSTKEFMITNRHFSGKRTGQHLIGLNCMQRQEFSLPNTEIDWSIPPDAVPVQRSPAITFSMNFYRLPSTAGPWVPQFA